MIACITGSEALLWDFGEAFKTCGHCAGRTRGKCACAWHWQVVLLCRASCPLPPRNKDKIFPLCGSLCVNVPKLSLWAQTIGPPSLPASSLQGRKQQPSICQARLRHRLTRLRKYEGCSGVIPFQGRGVWLQLLNGFLCLWLLLLSPFTLKMWFHLFHMQQTGKERQSESKQILC